MDRLVGAVLIRIPAVPERHGAAGRGAPPRGCQRRVPQAPRPQPRDPPRRADLPVCGRRAPWPRRRSGTTCSRRASGPARPTCSPWTAARCRFNGQHTPNRSRATTSSCSWRSARHAGAGASGAPSPRKRSPGSLTGRELEIVRLVALGRSGPGDRRRAPHRARHRSHPRAKRDDQGRRALARTAGGQGHRGRARAELTARDHATAVSTARRPRHTMDRRHVPRPRQTT